MHGFHLYLPETVYVIGDGYDEKLAEDVEFVIFATDMPSAHRLAHRFIGTQTSINPPRSALARVEPIERAIQSWSVTAKFEPLAHLINRASKFIGSIAIDGVVVRHPLGETFETIYVLAIEGERERVLCRDLFIMDEEPRLEWGDPSTELTVAVFAREIQAMF